MTGVLSLNIGIGGAEVADFWMGTRPGGICMSNVKWVKRTSLVFTLIGIPGIASADFQSGISAANRGDYLTASLNLFKQQKKASQQHKPLCVSCIQAGLRGC